jgi:hypothetical protein
VQADSTSVATIGWCEMKLVNLFGDFLTNTVNLNQSRVDVLADNVAALQNFIRASEWKPRVRRFEEQGSWAHETIIKPVDNGEFDADLLVLVDPVSGWSAQDYISTLGKIFSESGTYQDKVKIWDYCVTITYAGEQKVDIAPCVVSRLWDGSLEVCNRKEIEFERTEPVEYTNWIKERNGYSGQNSFRKVTRLFKYLRDIKGRFVCPSVLLTTLIGYRIDWFDKGSDNFSDTPTTLQTVMGRLDDWLQLNTERPVVPNPKLVSENLAELWTPDQYKNFRESIHRYRMWVDEAIATDSRADSIQAWRKLFDDEFAKGEEIRVASAVVEGVSQIKKFLMATAAHANELVDVVKGYGIAILPPEFSSPPHMHAPHWRRLLDSNANVRVIAEWRSTKDASHGSFVRSGDAMAPKGGVWFDVRVNDYDSLPQGFSVQWRITNTGVISFARNEQRGGFYLPQRTTARWEDLRYRGVHIAEAFIIRNQDQILVAQSEPFFVVVE